MKTYQVTIEVQVSDAGELRRAALERALADGITASDWRKTRRERGPGADLVMLLDPGISPPGTEIMDSTAEQVG